MVLLACIPSWGTVSIRERGLWPADWPPALEAFRDQARTFEVNTDVLENVYEITLRTPEELSPGSCVFRLLDTSGEKGGKKRRTPLIPSGNHRDTEGRAS